VRIRYVGHNIETIKNTRYEVADIPRFTADQVKDFRPVFRFLNDKDRDILYLIFVARKKQSAVERILGRSQPSLCYDIKRIRKRLQFICYLQTVYDIYLDFLHERASEYTDEELEIMTLMFYSTSLTQTARLMGMPQIRVRYRFDKILRKMEDLGHWDMYEIFQTIRTNLNIVKRIYKPADAVPSSPSSF